MTGLGFLGAAMRALRYRFFRVAGVFPYLLGAAVAYRAGGVDWWLLCVGLIGIVFVGLGIESMNEYFDSTMGGDRVFASAERVATPWRLRAGLAGFGLAFLVALYLATLRDWWLLCFVFAGAAAALCYLVPPVHLSYRGLGEGTIAISYGTGLTLGSFYLQAGRLSWRCAFVSLLPALLAFTMALANEVPDYYGDRLVGKRNIIVRIGQRRGARLYGIVTALCFGVMAVGLIAGALPPLLWAGFLLVPLAWKNVVLAQRHYERPADFVRVIRGTVVLYVLVNAVAISSYVWQ